MRDNEKVKAVVLRVNSPGGSALASDVIWREIELLRAEKPVIVSMGSYAASGGYYISCPADAIVADKMTLTGSIGVFGMFLDTRDALKNKLGITVDGVKSNASADFAATSPLTPLQRAMIMRGVDRVYTTFTNHVAEGRNLPIGKVLDIAGGRVWLGKDALEVGLIDTYGGLKTAIALAVDKAELGDGYRVVEVKEEPTGFAAIIASLNVSVREAFARSELGLMMKEYNTVREALVGAEQMVEIRDVGESAAGAYFRNGELRLDDELRGPVDAEAVDVFPQVLVRAAFEVAAHRRRGHVHRTADLLQREFAGIALLHEPDDSAHPVVLVGTVVTRTDLLHLVGRRCGKVVEDAEKERDGFEAVEFGQRYHPFEHGVDRFRGESQSGRRAEQHFADGTHVFEREELPLETVRGSGIDEHEVLFGEIFDRVVHDALAAHVERQAEHVIFVVMERRIGLLVGPVVGHE